MAKLVIEGGKRLSGEVTLQGSKNSILPILAGAVLCSGECVLHNCPLISDVEASIKILSHLGCFGIADGNTMTINPSGMTSCEISQELMCEMRSSIVFLGAIIGKMGRAVVGNPGGCELGSRPIDLHISSLQQMGIEIEVDEKSNQIYAKAEKGIQGAEIFLRFASVGATENIILAAVLAKGKTIIHNAAKEPEISDLADFLNRAGAKISGCGSKTVEIIGVKKLNGCEHTIMPDRIVAATYMSAAAITGGKITINNVMPHHLISTIDKYNETGCDINFMGKSLTLNPPKILKPIPDVKTFVYPGFPTDSGPLLMGLLTKAEGVSRFTEKIFDDRLKYVNELNNLGADITVLKDSNIAEIVGVKQLHGAKCTCTDLRGGAAIAVAALGADGITEIDDIFHIQRGYEDIARDLSILGADIKYTD